MAATPSTISRASSSTSVGIIPPHAFCSPPTLLRVGGRLRTPGGTISWRLDLLAAARPPPCVGPAALVQHAAAAASTSTVIIRMTMTMAAAPTAADMCTPWRRLWPAGQEWVASESFVAASAPWT